MACVSLDCLQDFTRSNKVIFCDGRLLPPVAVPDRTRRPEIQAFAPDGLRLPLVIDSDGKVIAKRKAEALRADVAIAGHVAGNSSTPPTTSRRRWWNCGKACSTADCCAYPSRQFARRRHLRRRVREKHAQRLKAQSKRSASATRYRQPWSKRRNKSAADSCPPSRNSTAHTKCRRNRRSW